MSLMSIQGPVFFISCPFWVLSFSSHVQLFLSLSCLSSLYCLLCPYWVSFLIWLSVIMRVTTPKAKMTMLSCEDLPAIFRQHCLLASPEIGGFRSPQNRKFRDLGMPSSLSAKTFFLPAGLHQTRTKKFRPYRKL